MTLNLTVPSQTYADFRPKITVIGVGGGGANAVDNMIVANLQGVEFVVANTDAQQLMHSRADRRIQLGPHLTQGLGAGAKPEIGRAAAEEAVDELAHHLDGCHMVFITAGMGGGTGTGAAPVIARMARERNILTIGVVTKPFTFEGPKRNRAAETGIAELQQYVDTLIVIPNQNLFRIANERTTYKEAFKMADNVLYMGVRGVTDLMMAPGLVNLDFADIRTVMAEMGKAMMGTGEASGEDRARQAAEAAISNPLLEDTSVSGARGLLVNITGGDDMTLFEFDQAANRIREEVEDDANIIIGSTLDDSLAGSIRVSVVATGIDVGARTASTQQESAPTAGTPEAPAATESEPAPVHIPMPNTVSGRTAPNYSMDTSRQQPAETSEPRTPSPRAGLFTDQSTRAAEPQPRRLFGLMTGALRRQPEAAPPPPAPARPAPTPQPAQQQPTSEPVAIIKPAQPDDSGLDIPAFMRRKN